MKIRNFSRLQCGLSFKPATNDKVFCKPTCRKLYGKKHLGHSTGNRKCLHNIG